jgi:hypothetical protein
MMIAWAGTRIVVALLTESLMLMEFGSSSPMEHCLIAEGCGIKRRMAIAARTDVCVLVNPGKRKRAVSDEGIAGGMCSGLGQ